jgi:hypothetical protein
MSRRCKVPNHAHKNSGEKCFICKSQLNRTARTVTKGSQKIKVCRSCADKNNLS